MITLSCQQESLGQALDFLQETLTALKLPGTKVNTAMLTAEELMVKMIALGSGKLTLTVKELLGAVSITVSAPGQPFALENAGLSLDGLGESDLSPETEMAIRAMVLNAHRDAIRLKHRRGVNTAFLTVQKSDQAKLVLTLSCLFCGLLCGLLLRLLAPASVSGWISRNVFSTVSTLFVNAVMAMVGPLVFFSMATSVANFTDLRSLGRMGAKVLGLYMVTSVMAIALGFGIFQLFQPGEPTLMAYAADSAAVSTQAAPTSIRDVLMNVIPNNFINAFANLDMLQIIVLGILLGISAGNMGRCSQSVQNSLDAMNELFSKAISIIVQALPVTIFCSMANVVITTQSTSFVSLLEIGGCIYLGSILQMAFYLLMLLVLAKLNPLIYLRKFSQVMLTAFSLCSSNAVMPMSMKTLDQKIGVSPKIYSFSIPWAPPSTWTASAST